MDSKRPVELTDDQYDTAEHRKDWETNGKTSVNELLWRYLPGETPLGVADEISLKIYMLIEARYRKVVCDD